jgi:hypothetical protein
MSPIEAMKDRSPRWAKDLADLTTRRYATTTASLRPAPDFLIVGTKRGGTTSLFNYLLMHPAVLGLFPQSRGKKSTDYFFKEQHRGDRWYRSHFHAAPYRSLVARRTGQVPVGGEASPYYLWDPRVAAQAHALNPELKAVALLRDPVERAWSHYQERVHMGVEPLSFADALAAEDVRTEGELDRMLSDPGYYSQAHDWFTYRSRGVYLPQLQNWTASFPAEQLLVLTSEQMYGDVQGTFDEVCRFLGLDPVELPTTRTFNAITRSSLPEEARAELKEYYAPYDRPLEEHLGRPLGWAR